MQSRHSDNTRHSDNILGASEKTVWKGSDSLQRMRAIVGNLDPCAVRISGEITETVAGHARVAGLSSWLTLGDTVHVGHATNNTLAEVIRLDAGGVTIKSYAQTLDVGLGAPVWRGGRLTLAPHADWVGRVIDALGKPIDDKGPLLQGPRRMDINAEAPPSTQRARINRPLQTGVRAIDLFTPICAGQRIGLFSGSGVGKSTLLGMMAKGGQFDIVVAALVGERGREVREFLEETVSGPNWITVVSTADESPMMRRLAPKTATCIAEYFRDQGLSVLLVVDSVTRFAHASREIALAGGEPAVARGFAPSVFADLPRLLERAGPGLDGSGTITAIFTVLVDGDDHNDPIADTIRGTLDGHIVLDRAIAGQGRYPAIDVLASLSRLAQLCWTEEQRVLIRRLRAMTARFEDTRDLRALGGYTPGQDGELDQAVHIVQRIYTVLGQTPSDPVSTDPFRELAEALRGRN